MVEKTYVVPDISCEHCVSSITKELTKIQGVESVNVDIPTKVVTVRHTDAVSDDQLVAGIDEAGFDVATTA